MFLTKLLDRRWRHPALVPLFFLALALLLRSFSFVAAVIDTDEGLYMLQAREWLDGNWPIVAVWDMHPVGAPAIFAVFMAIFGDDIWVLRVLGAVCVAATASALFSAVRYAGGPPALGLAAGVLYIAHSGLLGGLATNTEILFAPMIGWAMALGLREGVDAAALYEVITHSAGNSWMFENRMAHVLAADYTPLSAVDIFVKDLGIVLDMARSSKFPLPLSATAHQMFMQASTAGFAKEDDSAVIKIFPGIELPKAKQ
jgi:hypothetical protein